MTPPHRMRGNPPTSPSTAKYTTGGTRYQRFSQRSSGKRAKSRMRSRFVALYFGDMTQPTCDHHRPLCSGEWRSWGVSEYLW